MYSFDAFDVVDSKCSGNSDNTRCIGIATLKKSRAHTNLLIAEHLATVREVVAMFGVN